MRSKIICRAARPSARALDAATVQVGIAPGTDTVTLIAMLEDAPVQTDDAARVVINERTGTVVMGGDVTVSPCAVAHGSLTVQITDTHIGQPASTAQSGRRDGGGSQPAG